MGLFKGLPEKPYTKADYYREMEERHAAKLAAKAAPVVVVPVREPEWLEPEVKTTEDPVSLEVAEETVVVPFVEPEPSVVEQPKAVEVAPVEPPPEAKKAAKPKRKKS